MSDTSETRTEWGVRLTWPDGHSEVRTHGNLAPHVPYSRRTAEQVAQTSNFDREERHTQALAEVVARDVTVGPWTTINARAVPAS